MIITGRRIRNVDRHLGSIPTGTEIALGVVDIHELEGAAGRCGLDLSAPDGTTILPSIVGPVSRFNAEGRQVPQRDQPMETAYRQVEWHWSEWHGRDRLERSDVRDVPYKRYPRKFVPPPSLELTQANYENVVATCPSCGRECVFNRASDLCTFDLIAGRDVSCQHADCGKPFHIMGDSVNGAHELLVFECVELIAHKHYMSCILSLAQAYEMFFSLFFRVELLYRPFAADARRSAEEFNALSLLLSETIKKHPFAWMRALFLRHVVADHTPRTLSEAEPMIRQLAKHAGDPKDSAIQGVPDLELAHLLMKVKTTGINDMRNDVVHKRGYRPTAAEASKYLEETRDILFPLTILLDLHDDINLYAMGMFPA